MQTENKTNPEDKNIIIKKSFTPVKLNVPDYSEADEPNLAHLFGDTDFKEVNPFVYEKELLLRKNNKLESLFENLGKTKRKYFNKNNNKKIVLLSASTAGVLALITVGASLLGEKNTNKADAVVLSKIINQNLNTKTEEVKSVFKKDEIFSNKGFIIYETTKDDTISDISQKFGISPEILKTINNLQSDKDLKEKLIIPANNGKIHKVASGETLEVIARKYDTTTDVLIAVNKNNLKNPHFLQIDQPVFIPENITSKEIKTLETQLVSEKPKVKEDPKAVKPDISVIPKTNINKAQGFVHVLRAGETPGHLAMRYGVSLQKILTANNITNPERLQIGQKLLIPGTNSNKRNSYSSRSISAGTGIVSSGRMSWPSAGGYLSSGYGWRGFSFHKGIDIAAPIGTGIRASMSGTVVHAGWEGAYGNSIHIRHANGLVTRYAHCSRLYVGYGQAVSAGQIVGAVGMTGRSTGPHLHFEVIANGRAVNPRNYL